MSVTGEHPNIVRTVTPQNVFSHTNSTTQPKVNNESLPSTKGSGGGGGGGGGGGATNSTTQPKVNNESLPSTKGSGGGGGGGGGTMHPPFRVGVNRGQQIPQLVMRSPLPVPNLRKESQVSNAQTQYTYDVEKTEEFIVKEKFITFPYDHQLPNKEGLKGKVYCKYQNFSNHSTNACWSFKNII